MAGGGRALTPKPRPHAHPHPHHGGGHHGAPGHGGGGGPGGGGGGGRHGTGGGPGEGHGGHPGHGHAPGRGPHRQGGGGVDAPDQPRRHPREHHDDHRRARELDRDAFPEGREHGRLEPGEEIDQPRQQWKVEQDQHEPDGRTRRDATREREPPGEWHPEPAEASPPRRRGLLWLVLMLVAGLLLLVVVTFVAVLAGPMRMASAGGGCPARPGDPTLPGNQAPPGELGGIAGTGITAADLATVRRSPHASSRITPGDYVSTAYGPPWGGIQGQGNATSGGLRIGGGSPRKYWIAVDPKLIGHSTWVYLWPNPFGWKGPFLAADTGGAIDARRIDFYDWRGRGSQYGWGRRTVKVSATPLVPGAPTPPPAAPAPGTDAGADVGAAAAACGEGGILDSGGGWGGVTGDLVVAPGANRAGVPMQGPILQFMRGVAGRAQRRVIVTTGTNHSRNTVSGNVSDHWAGLGADMGSVANKFPIGGEGGTVIAAAALATAGVPADTARRLAAGGGAHSLCSTAPDGARWRVQIIWRSHVGGNHFNHVHVGLGRGCAFKGVRTA